MVFNMKASQFSKAKWWGSRNQQPILCIHGWQDNAATFDMLIPLLPGSLSFLCIDLPGHGKSSHLPDGVPYYLQWDGIVLIRRILRNYGWSNVAIMGHSLGGIIGFLYAAVYPDDVEALISLDVVAPIFEFLGKKSVTQVAGLIDRRLSVVHAWGGWNDRAFARIIQNLLIEGGHSALARTIILHFAHSVTPSRSFVHVAQFLHYDDIKDSKDPVEDYEAMIELAENGHHGRLTRESCECLMTRGMYQRSNGKYAFRRDNRVKVGYIAPSSPDFIRNCAKSIKCRYLNIKATPYEMDTWPVYKELCDSISANAREFKLVFVEGTHHVHLNEPGKVAKHISDFLLFSNSEQFCII